MKTLKKPYVLKKLDKCEEFVIRILKDEQIIQKAKVLQSILQTEEELNIIFEMCAYWSQLKHVFIDQTEKNVQYLRNILDIALQISMKMAAKNKIEEIQRTQIAPAGFDLNKCLIMFFEKKSLVYSIKGNSQTLLYDLIIKQLAGRVRN